MAKKSEFESFEWICNVCQYLHSEISIPSETKDGVIKLACKECGSIRHIKLVDLQESELADNWISIKCRQCLERTECLFSKTAKAFNRRFKLINKLGFCEDYVVDSSQFSTSNKQMCHEEVTFKDLYNSGNFPIDEVVDALIDHK